MSKTYIASSYLVPDRLFQVWEFTPTHSQLILQSNAPHDSGGGLRIEVLFTGVIYMSLPSAFRGLELRKANSEEAERLIDGYSLDDVGEAGLYLLSPSRDWFVASGPPSWAEADLAYSDPSVFFPEGWEIDPDIVIGQLR